MSTSTIVFIRVSKTAACYKLTYRGLNQHITQLGTDHLIFHGGGAHFWECSIFFWTSPTPHDFFLSNLAACTIFF
jgi:hypothetical protein